jgi:hypothetical protein
MSTRNGVIAWRSGLGAIVALSAVVWSTQALADPPVRVDSSVQDPVTLRRSYTPAASEELRIRYLFEGELTNVARNSEQEQRIELGVVVGSTVDEVDADGNGVVTIEVQSATLDVRAAGRAQNTRDAVRAIEAMAVREKLSPRGERLDYEPISTPDPESDLGFALHASLGEERPDHITFPERSLVPGAGWEEQHSYVAAGTRHSEESRFSFVGYTGSGEGASAVLREDLTIWLEVGEGASYRGVPGPAMGRSVLTRYYVFDLAAGRFTQMRGEGGTVMRSTGNEEPIDLTATITESIDY